MGLGFNNDNITLQLLKNNRINLELENYIKKK